MAPVSYLRPTENWRGRASGAHSRSYTRYGRRGPRRYLAVGLLLAIIAAIAVGAFMVVTSKPRLTSDPAALARVQMPLGGASIQSLSVVSGPHSAPVPVDVRGEEIWPRGTIGSGQQVTIQVVVKRPAWIGWLAGKIQRMQMTLTTPVAHLTTQYTTLSAGARLRVEFSQPVSAYFYGAPGRLQRQPLATPQTTVIVAHSGPAGSVWVAGVPRNWETAAAAVVSWFPAGTKAGVVASPAPGTTISPGAAITLTFSKPYSQVLGRSMPPVSPATQGTWQPLNSHTLVFRPEGYGYGLGAKVSVGLPSNVGVVGGAASWTVPRGSTGRLQQLLAQLGYLPLNFSAAGPSVAPTPQAQEQAAIKPPAGTFSWRYGNVPPALHSMWQPGASGEMTRGAIMAFQNDHGITPDGDAGEVTWRALLGAAVAGHPSSFGYSFVTVEKNSQRLTLWHNGHTVVSTPVNTGIAQAPTASGTFAVYEHLRVTTMSGTNPDGSHYRDPGIQFVSYFNGGDALHAFTRAQYGSPQSLGCVEMALNPAGKVWPYTPIGTLVNVA